jgi:MoaA/NifB/PqqE/SkfB family radical SAM enzyme
MSKKNEIVEIIYFPTFKCNCRYTHCGIDFNVQYEELPCAEISKAIVGSNCIAKDVPVNIQITGGEAFLVNDLIDFVIPILEKFDNAYVYSTLYRRGSGQ